MSFHPSPISTEELHEELFMNLRDLLDDVFFLECICSCRDSWDAFFSVSVQRGAIRRAADYLEDHVSELLAVSRLLVERIIPKNT